MQAAIVHWLLCNPQMSRLDVALFLSPYYRQCDHRFLPQNMFSGEKYGAVTLLTSYRRSDQRLHVEVLNAVNLLPMDSNGESLCKGLQDTDHQAPRPLLTSWRLFLQVSAIPSCSSVWSRATSFLRWRLAAPTSKTRTSTPSLTRHSSCELLPFSLWFTVGSCDDPLTLCLHNTHAAWCPWSSAKQSAHVWW